MLGIDPNLGVITLYGIYPLFSINSFIFCLISGSIGSIMVFFDKDLYNKKFKIRLMPMRFFIGFSIGGISYGILNDYFDMKPPKEYIAAIIGFLSFPLFKSIFNNLDYIADKFLGEIFRKIGIKKDKEEENNT